MLTRLCIAIHQSTLKSFGVKSLMLFGSVARDEAQTNSNVDECIHLCSPHPKSLSQAGRGTSNLALPTPRSRGAKGARRRGWGMRDYLRKWDVPDVNPVSRV
ncbi:MAG: nucleotidyltransferase domain-containing protein [Cyanobacteria bacterium]|nr:nucleotidyltransferase domain-containing protein [Cyanobacteriota bacterium]MDW8200412.1 nucleotidyltransferase domain-containing protein [Cyanobacteriota bacterium SKYGB_h_bin112]